MASWEHLRSPLQCPRPANDRRSMRVAVIQFVRELQRNLARDDRPAIAARVRYPLTVFVGGVRIPISSAAALIEQYDIVFTPALKAAIADARGSPAGQAARLSP